MQVSQLMKKDVHVCTPRDSALAAARLMWEHDLGSVPVVDADSRVVGMITDRDIAMAAYLQGKPLREIAVEAVMSRGVHTCAPTEDVNTAQERMRRFQVRRLPVTDELGFLQGMLSLNDLALEAKREIPNRRHPLRLEAIGETLAMVGTHREPVSLAAE